jgi:hypothetical protein
MTKPVQIVITIGDTGLKLPLDDLGVDTALCFFSAIKRQREEVRQLITNSRSVRPRWF